VPANVYQDPGPSTFTDSHLLHMAGTEPALQLKEVSTLKHASRASCSRLALVSTTSRVLMTVCRQDANHRTMRRPRRIWLGWIRLRRSRWIRLGRVRLRLVREDEAEGGTGCGEAQADTGGYGWGGPGG